MFYSQIILAKKGPFGDVWLAAHWGEKKLGRTQIFSADIATSVDNIVNPAVPLALRVSGHLLLGVVRIYSRKVKYLLKDCDEAMIKIKMAFKPDGDDQAEDARVYIDASGGGGVGNIQNFGDTTLIDPLDLGIAGGPIGGIFVQPLQLHGGDANAFGVGGGGGGVSGSSKFAIPFNLEGDVDQDVIAGWVEADDDEEEEDADDIVDDPDAIRRAIARKQTQDGFSQDDSALAAVNMTLDSQLSGMGGGVNRIHEEEEEGWHSFDPDAVGVAEEEEEQERHVFEPEETNTNVNQTKDSHVSDVEMVRGGGVDDTSSIIGRPSIIGSDIASVAPQTDQASIQEKSQVSDNEFPIQEEEDAPMNPFDDSPLQHHQDSSLISTTPEKKRTSLAIGGLDVVADLEEEEEAEKNKPKKRSATKRKRRRRRIEIDNEQTELSSEHIKAMLRDTSDIVRQNRTHPADYVSDDNEESRLDLMTYRPWKKQKGLFHKEVSSLPYEKLFARPNMGDSGTLAPELLSLWERNSARLRGEPLPFRMKGVSGEDQKAKLAEEIMDEAAEKEEDIEMARHYEANEQPDDEMQLSTDVPAQERLEEEDEFPTIGDDEMPHPFDDEEDRLAQEQNVEGTSFVEDTFGVNSPARSEGSQRSSFSLGAVNDLEEETFGGRYDQDETLASSNSKWHKHTVKVLEMLKKNMKAEEDDSNNLPTDLSYDKLSYGVSRRTACGVFFELLQLKTWDFIELNQSGSYSDIRIAPGARFNEAPPSE